MYYGHVHVYNIMCMYVDMYTLGNRAWCQQLSIRSLPQVHAIFSRAGLGPALLTGVIRTAPPGRPGSPSHVTGTWVSGDQAALVCWEPSEVGMPFLSYTIEVRELESNITKIWKLRVGEVKDNLPNCTAGYSVSVLIMLLL